MTDSGLSHQLQSLLDDFVNGQENVRNGLLLVEGREFMWKGASGIADPEIGLPMLPDDSFNIDSVAKMMTSTIVMKLVEAKELRLEDRIARFLPESLVNGLHVFQGRDFSKEITLRNLLNHTSGIPDNWANPGFLDLILEDPQKRWMPEETIEFVKKHCQPAFPPGTGFQYSDPGYNLLGMIIEKVTGKALHYVYRASLLDPLGMENTYRPSHENPRSRIPGRTPSFRYLDDLECTLLPAVMTADWAGGGLISTSEDINRFLRAFIRDEIFQHPGTKYQMLQWVDSGPFHNYGFGIARVNFQKSNNPLHKGLGEIWGHAGSSHNFAYYWPDQDLTLIGTLNQIDCAWDFYDSLASIMQTMVKY